MKLRYIERPMQATMEIFQTGRKEGYGGRFGWETMGYAAE